MYEYVVKFLLLTHSKHQHWNNSVGYSVRVGSFLSQPRTNCEAPRSLQPSFCLHDTCSSFFAWWLLASFGLEWENDKTGSEKWIQRLRGKLYGCSRISFSCAVLLSQFSFSTAQTLVDTLAQTGRLQSLYFSVCTLATLDCSRQLKNLGLFANVVAQPFLYSFILKLHTNFPFLGCAVYKNDRHFQGVTLLFLTSNVKSTLICSWCVTRTDWSVVGSTSTSSWSSIFYKLKIAPRSQTLRLLGWFPNKVRLKRGCFISPQVDVKIKITISSA